MHRFDESYYLVAQFPQFALSIGKEISHEFSTRHVFSHRSGQFLKVWGWPAFSDDGGTIAFFRGSFMAEHEGILAIYRADSDYLEPMAIFHTRLSWFTAVNFKSNNEFIATMTCLEYVDVDDLGKHWMETGQSEEVLFQYNGGVWRPSKLNQCAIEF